MNLLKALNGLSAPKDNENAVKDAPAKAPTPSPQPPAADTYNAMASVLERHERISNRVKNRK